MKGKKGLEMDIVGWVLLVLLLIIVFIIMIKVMPSGEQVVAKIKEIFRFG